MKENVRLACIASGSGTDFESIAKAWKDGWIPEVSEVVLISTKKGAGCLDKAARLGIESTVCLPINKALDKVDLHEALGFLGGVDLVFLVGCVFIVPIVVPTYNIHPAHTRKHGGKTMHGLKVHKHVLAEIMDEIERGWKKVEDEFFTDVIVHDADAPYDQGIKLLTAKVQIPPNIIGRLMKKTLSPKRAARMLQRHVLPYEHLLLPTAVRMAARKILEE